jgi:tetratricopeptide (TPR) repeat protein
MEDELQELRDHFYAYNFNKCLELSRSIEGNDMVQGEKDALKARSYLGLGTKDAVQEIKGMNAAENPALKATAYALVYLRTENEQQRATGRDRLLDLANQARDPNVLFLAAAVLAHEGQYLEAFNLVKDVTTPDISALKAQLLVLLDRVDLAEAEQRSSPDGGDSAAGKVLGSTLQMAAGNYQEAFLTYQDLQSQYWGDEESVALLNGKAAANIHRGLHQEAQEDLQRALTLDPSNALTLANAACVAVHLGQYDEADQHINAVCEKSKLHWLAVKKRELQEAVDRFKASH